MVLTGVLFGHKQFVSSTPENREGQKLIYFYREVINFFKAQLYMTNKLGD